MGRYPEIWIENTESRGKHVAMNTKVFVLRENENGEEEKIDISTIVRAVDVRLHVGEVVTAKLDCFITGFSGRAEIEGLFLKEIKPRSRWRRLVDATSFGSKGWREYA